jgi:hypothetical protein
MRLARKAVPLQSGCTARWQQEITSKPRTRTEAAQMNTETMDVRFGQQQTDATQVFDEVRCNPCKSMRRTSPGVGH